MKQEKGKHFCPSCGTDTTFWEGEFCPACEDAQADTIAEVRSCENELGEQYLGEKWLSMDDGEKREFLDEVYSDM